MALFERAHPETLFLCSSAERPTAAWTWIVVLHRLLAWAGTDLREAYPLLFVCASESRGAVGTCPGPLSCAGAQSRWLSACTDRWFGTAIGSLAPVDSRSDRDVQLGICSGLTFEVRGGRKQAKPDCGRPLDRRVRELVHRALLNWPGREAVLAETSGVWLPAMNGGVPSDCDEA